MRNRIPFSSKKLRPPRKKPDNPFGYFLVIALIVTSLYVIFSQKTDDSESFQNAKEVPISTVQKQYQAEQLRSINIENNKLKIELKDGTKELSYKPTLDTLNDLGFDNPEIATEINIVNTEASAFWSSLLQGVLPVILLVFLFFFLMRQVQKGASSAFSFGKSKAKLYGGQQKPTTFKDVAGCDEAKSELEEIVDFLKTPQKYTRMGAKIPRGVMLIGAPGTGKTLLARAVAGEAKVPFFSISGSEFVEMFVGVGASRVRDLFEKAKRNSPSIIFIDEIDAVGRQRGAGMGGGHDEREQTLNQILTDMDGFDNETNVIVMAATNRPDVLDKALLRPGRFDRRVIIDKPDLNAREAILKVHVVKKPLAKNVKLKDIARKTPGFSGADLANILNEAAILAAKQNKKTITQKDIEDSVEKVMMGPEKKSRLLTEQERKITAFHEIGHALIGTLLPNCDPVHKVSIISRGMALGITWFLPQEDRHLYPQNKFEDELCSLMGGHVSEKIIFNEVTTGASNDLQRASQIARQMVTDYGMSLLGPVVYGDSQESSYLGIDLGKQRNYSDSTATKIDKEVEKILKKAYKKAETILTKHKKLLIKISHELLKKETLSAKDFNKLIGKIKKSSAKN